MDIAMPALPYLDFLRSIQSIAYIPKFFKHFIFSSGLIFESVLSICPHSCYNPFGDENG